MKKTIDVKCEVWIRCEVDTPLTDEKILELSENDDYYGFLNQLCMGDNYDDNLSDYPEWYIYPDINEQSLDIVKTGKRIWIDGKLY